MRDVIKVIAADSDVNSLKLKREKFTESFNDQLPVRLKSIMLGKDAFFYNAYSTLEHAASDDVNLNVVDTIPLDQINDDGFPINCWPLFDGSRSFNYFFFTTFNDAIDV